MLCDSNYHILEKAKLETVKDQWSPGAVLGGG